jgi:hypothetical protein
MFRTCHQNSKLLTDVESREKKQKETDTMVRGNEQGQSRVDPIKKGVKTVYASYEQS